MPTPAATDLPHYPDNFELIKNKLPNWLTDASRTLLQAHGDSLLLTHTHKARLAEYLQALQGLQAFAVPILSNALKTRFGYLLDPQRDRIGGVRLITAETLSTPRKVSVVDMSLLEAALKNFVAPRHENLVFYNESSLYRQVNARQSRPIRAFTLRGFVELCRELDIGGQYDRHMSAVLLPKKPSGEADNRFRDQFELSERYELITQTHIALMKGNISHSTHQFLLAASQQSRLPSWDSKPVSCCELQMFNFRTPLSSSTGVTLKGAWLIEHQDTLIARNRPCIVYLSGDPEQALKQYASFEAFEQELGHRLGRIDYRGFFNRYINQRTQSAFFSALEHRLDTSGTAADLQLKRFPLIGHPLRELYTQHLVKLLDDGNFSAVPVADIDRQDHREHLQSLGNIGLNLLNVAALFVPGLGEAMLAVAGAQMFSQIYNGIEDWHHDEREQALKGLIGVTLNLALIGGITVFAHRFAGAGMVKDLKQVSLPNGESTLWKPDLTPYEQSLVLPESAQPNASGLYEINDRQYLKQGDKVYEVELNPQGNRGRIKHPDRPGQYAPAFWHNGAGAWFHELENPLRWQGPQLMHRLSLAGEAFSDIDAARIMAVSDTDEALLRRVHFDSQRPPALLKDSQLRFRLDRDIQRLIEQMARGEAAPDESMQEQILLDLWQSQPKALRLVDDQGRVVMETIRTGTTQEQQVVISLDQLHNGDLLKTVLNSPDLDESDIRTLLGESQNFATPAEKPETRLLNFRKQIARHAQLRRKALFESQYRFRTQSQDPSIGVLQKAFPDLPVTVLEELAEQASGAQLQALRESAEIAPGIADEAALYQQQVRLARAREGLYLASSGNADSEKLILHSVQRLPGWSTQVRIEIRAQSSTGPLLDSIGTSDAPISKVLIKENGLYQTRDALDQELHDSDDLYASLLHALPDTQRSELGYPSPKQGAQLKQAVQNSRLPGPDEIRQLLDMPPAIPSEHSPMALAKRRPGYQLSGRGAPQAGSRWALEDRVARLFPSFSDEQIRQFIGSLSGSRVFDELRRLEQEYEQLTEELDLWSFITPSTHPVSGERLSLMQRINQQRTRAQFAEAIRRCWRREPDLLYSSNPEEHGYTLSANGLLGELPGLSVDFAHVRHLNLAANTPALELAQFLEHFPNLRQLSIRGFQLDTLPESISQGQLTELSLIDCSMHLTPQTAPALSAMQSLKILDLSGNPLGLVPDLSQLHGLAVLDLSRTGINALPRGLFELPRLEAALLVDNAISDLPPTLNEMSSNLGSGLDLSGNPLSETSLQRARDYYRRTGHSLGVQSQAERTRIRALYPGLDNGQLESFIRAQPRLLEESLEQLSRLETQYRQLSADLLAWSGDIPVRHPETQQPLSAVELAVESLNRQDFALQLQRSWQRQSEEILPDGTLFYNFTYTQRIIGSLPALSADFSHIARLEVHGYGVSHGLDAFLHSFPHLRVLYASGFIDRDFPAAIFDMPHLRNLELPYGRIRLSETSHQQLADMTGLRMLDLSGNPLQPALRRTGGTRLTPNVTQMTDLRVLDLSDSGIQQTPEGLFGLRALGIADFRDNQIRDIPESLFEVPTSQPVVYDFRNNPLTEASLQRVRSYRELNGGVQQVRILIGDDVSSSEESESDSDNGGSVPPAASPMTPPTPREE
ncbi:dermonecrotic toxin domain-containing protein [Pseudomonas gingeri]|uniref:Dermonecrotic toxin N-terminal domain-containing protein n=1 Tax=Pseudomonas gingeri TaxID=117681 RepID=A0A7Y8BNK3_9PSED|nr:DUF6543 domain-containing protein [Pseudomonas gingeri]NWB50249.1 hypothetical protein [Pseudomonas gingeri]